MAADRWLAIECDVLDVLEMTANSNGDSNGQRMKLLLKHKPADRKFLWVGVTNGQVLPSPQTDRLAASKTVIVRLGDTAAAWMLRSKQPGLRAVTNILEGLGKESIACGSGTVNSILETLQTTLQNKTPKLTEKMKAQLVIKHSDVSWAIEGWLEEYE